jgi:hypothetical protein
MMRWLPRWSEITNWIGRSLVVGLVYPVVLAGADLMTYAVGLPTPAIARQADPVLMLLASVLTGFGSALVLGPLSARLALSLPGRALAVLTLLFGVGNAINLIEALFFTTFAADQLPSLPSLLVSQLLVALLLARLFQPAGPQPGLLIAGRAFFRQRPWASWTWRLVLAGLLYVPTYFFFGSLIAPIVLPAYQAAGSNLVVPSIAVILPLEAGRGLLFVLCVLPLVVGWRGSIWALAGWIGLVIAALGAWLPMLMIGFFPAAFQLPALLRVVHGIEITADAAVQGLTIAGLLVGGLAQRQRSQRHRLREGLDDDRSFAEHTPARRHYGRRRPRLSQLQHRLPR